MTPEDRGHAEGVHGAEVQFVDVVAAAHSLRDDSEGAGSGRRQTTVFRQGPVTVLTFAFEREGILKAHVSEGVVTILAMRGHLQVTAADEVIHLRTGQLLGLSPRVLHSVVALEQSDMLVTICRTASN